MRTIKAFASIILGMSSFAGCEKFEIKEISTPPGQTAETQPTPEPSAVPPTGAELRYAAAREVFQDTCFRCHGVNSNKGDFESLDLQGYQNYLTDSKDPLVVAGDPNASAIYFRLKGVSGDGDMPGRAPPLSQEQIHIIRDFILGINQP